MDTVLIDGQETPFKLSNRAKITFEKKNKVLIAEMKADHELLAKLVLEAINEGITLSGSSLEKLSLTKLLDYDAQADKSIIDEVVSKMNGQEGKQGASLNEA